MRDVQGLARPLGIRGVPPQRIALILAAGLGAVFLLTVAWNRWATPSDEHAYWLAARRLLAGQPLYDPAATSVTPYAYWYPPVVAQVVAPVAALLPAVLFSAIWTLLMLGCLWWLAGKDVLVALALVAFPPVAVEFWFRNVHLILAVLIVLGLTRSSIWYTVGGAIKIAPGIGILHDAVRGERREAGIAVVVGVLTLLVSFLISQAAWRDFISVLLQRGPGDVSGFLAVPYVVRLGLGVSLALISARLDRWRRPLVVVAIVVALPTLWITALSTLVAIVPLIRADRWERHGRR